MLKITITELKQLLANKRILLTDSILYLMFTLPNITTYYKI